MQVKEDFRISIVQCDLAWENKEANRKHIKTLLQELTAGDTDLIVLPEMFDTAFTMNAAALAEETASESLAWMRSLAAEKQAVLCGSIMVKDQEHYYNRCLWVYPNGTYKHYDKRHLFGLMKEDETFSQGNERVVVEWKAWRFCLQVCYDLRFPVFSRNQDDYDVLIYVANWPQARVYAWRQLLCARAIENQSYSVGVNRVGEDGNGIPFIGASVLHDPMGQPISSIPEGIEGVFTYPIFHQKLTKIRRGLPFQKDRDAFSLLD